RFGEPVTVPVGSERQERLHVYGIGHDPAEEPEPLLTFRRDPHPGIHVVLLHGSTPGAPHWESGSSLGLAWEALRDLGADYLALGDLHRYRGPDELEGLPACYPGSFAAVDFTESGLRGPVLAELAPGRPPVLQRLSSGVREVGAPLEIDVGGHTSDAEVADAVSAALESDAYPVAELRGEPPFALDPETVRAILVERHGAARVVDRSRFFDPARLEEIGRRNTVAGHIVRLGVARAGDVESESERRAIERGVRMALRALEVE
ncbi:MAG: hypothetical protein R3266_05010, partial [Gemmatimonadota bacterium]|nr:hypothetical protein [Gemmatimonadota bacterium]